LAGSPVLDPLSSAESGIRATRSRKSIALLLPV